MTARAAGAVLNYTTAVPVDRTVAEVQRLLVDAGASAVAVQYCDRQPVGVMFVLPTPHGARTYSVPVPSTGVLALLERMDRAGRFHAARKAAGTYTTPEHAARVAWRVVRDWLEAQLALVAAELAALGDVLLPYLQVQPGRTVVELWREHEQAALPPGRPE